MQILEWFLKGKTGFEDKCEDGIVLGNKLIAVIDGVTAKGKHLWSGRTSGFYAKELIVNYLKSGVENQQPEQLLNNLSDLLHTCYQEEIKEDIQEERLRASVIVYNDIYHEVWSYGDCQCMIDGEWHTHKKKIDIQNAKMRARYIENELENGKTVEDLIQNDTGRKAIEKNLLEQYQFENVNTEFGYAVLNGGDIAAGMIQKYPVKPGCKIILATDGYPILLDSLEESEKALNKLMKKDPLCIRENLSTKGIKSGCISFDDRCYCSLLI